MVFPSLTAGSNLLFLPHSLRFRLNHPAKNLTAQSNQLCHLQEIKPTDELFHRFGSLLPNQYNLEKFLTRKCRKQKRKNCEGDGVKRLKGGVELGSLRNRICVNTFNDNFLDSKYHFQNAVEKIPAKIQSQ